MVLALCEQGDLKALLEAKQVRVLAAFVSVPCCHTIHTAHALSEKGDLKALLEAKQVRVPPLAQRIRPHSAMAWLAHH